MSIVMMLGLYILYIIYPKGRKGQVKDLNMIKVCFICDALISVSLMIILTYMEGTLNSTAAGFSAEGYMYINTTSFWLVLVSILVAGWLAYLGLLKLYNLKDKEMIVKLFLDYLGAWLVTIGVLLTLCVALIFIPTLYIDPEEVNEVANVLSYLSNNESNPQLVSAIVRELEQLLGMVQFAVAHIQVIALWYISLIFVHVISYLILRKRGLRQIEEFYADCYLSDEEIEALINSMENGYDLHSDELFPMGESRIFKNEGLSLQKRRNRRLKVGKMNNKGKSARFSRRRRIAYKNRGKQIC